MNPPPPPHAPSGYDRAAVQQIPFPPARTVPLSQPDPFRIEVREHEAAAVVALFGELDVATVPEVDTAVALVRRRARHVTLDPRGLTFIDSSGVAMMVELDATARREGSGLALLKGSEAVQRVITLCGLDGRLEMADALPETGCPLDHALIATDLAGVVTRWNAEAERLYGWDADEVVGSVITHVTVGPHDEQAAEEILECIRRDGYWEGEFAVRRKDGTRFNAHVRHALIRGDDGAPAGLLGLSVDSSRFAPAAQIAGGGGCVGLHA